MFPVLWSVDPRDWCNNNADCVAYLVERETKENDIILLHDIYTGTDKMALTLPGLLAEKGYFPVEEMNTLRRINSNLKYEHPLRQLFWECTLRCNVSCRHCGSDCKHVATASDMPREDFMGVLDKLAPHIYFF